MMFKTHLLFGLLVGLFVSSFFDLDNKILFIVIVTLSSIIPDIDTPLSKVGSKVPILSWLLNLFFGHRGFIHTLWFPFIIFIILSLLELNLWASGFFLGYMSHLLLDSLTVQGIYFFYPINKTRVNGFIKTGGLLEFVLFLAILVGIGFILLV